jgi:hypothetical protein
MAAPPVLDDADQETEIVPRTRVIVVIEGCEGTVAGTSVVASDGVELPAAFVATTVTS